MDIFCPDDIQIDKQVVFQILESKEGSRSFRYFNSVYKKMLDEAYSLIRPKGFFTDGNIPDHFSKEKKEGFNKGIFCIATLGHAISNKSDLLFKDGKYPEGFLLDTIADQLLINFTDAIYKKKIIPMVKNKAIGVSKRYSPGCMNVPVKYQKYILEQFEPEINNEISITEGMMLSPLKSTTYFYLTGKSLPVRSYDWDCRDCDLKDCKYRSVSCTEITIISGEEKTKHSFLKAETLLEALTEKGWNIESYCSGAGFCGKCKVLISGNIPELLPEENEKLSKNTLLKGIRLACRHKPAEGMVIHLPEKTKTKYKIEQGFRFKNELQNSVSGLRRSSAGNRKNRREDMQFGIAIDIGTTTIVILILDLISLKTIDISTLLNPQRKYGEDVISRIQYSSTTDSFLLTRIIRESLISEIKKLIERNEIDKKKITKINVAGNTTMTHLFLGYDVKTLGVSPFKLFTLDAVTIPAKQVFENFFPEAEIYVFPAISAYIGSDIVSGMLNRGFEKLNEITLFVDLGTNGEIVLGNRDQILCASAAAGPAFEGARISCGTGCIEGAISFAGLNKGKVWYSTINNKPPVGLCGSGLIDLVTASLEEGLINKTGLLKSPYKKGGLFIDEDHSGNEMRLTQQDIRELQLAKSAVRAGIEILIKQFNMEYDDIGKVYLAGGFGNNINPASAVGIGLLPEDLKNKIELAGNSSLGGAVDLLANQRNKDAVKKMKENVTYIELSSYKDFNDKFAEYMSF